MILLRISETSRGITTASTFAFVSTSPRKFVPGSEARVTFSHPTTTVPTTTYKKQTGTSLLHFQGSHIARQDLPYSEIKHPNLQPSSQPTSHSTVLWIRAGLVALDCPEEDGQTTNECIVNNRELIKCLSHSCHNAESVDRRSQLSVDVPHQIQISDKKEEKETNVLNTTISFLGQEASKDERNKYMWDRLQEVTFVSRFICAHIQT